MVPLCQFGAEFRAGVDGWIDLATQHLLGRANRVHDLGQSDLAHDAEIHVATVPYLTPGNRAVNERDANPVGEWGQGLPQDISKPCSLENDASQLCEYGAARVGLEIDVSAPSGAAYDPGLHQALQVSLDGPLPGARRPGHLPQVERLVRMAEQQREHSSTSLAEEGRRKCVPRHMRPHNGDNCTRIEYEDQTPPGLASRYGHRRAGRSDFL